jgi:hypothetical protein
MQARELRVVERCSVTSVLGDARLDELSLPRRSGAGVALAFGEIRHLLRARLQLLA